MSIHVCKEYIKKGSIKEALTVKNLKLSLVSSFLTTPTVGENVALMKVAKSTRALHYKERVCERKRQTLG